MEADPDRCALIWEKDEPGDVERISYRYSPNLCLKITITICLVSVENLVLDQLIIPFIDIFLYSHYLSACFVLILLGEIRS